jgi:hypothetical protein
MFRGKLAQFVLGERVPVDVKENMIAAADGASNLHVVELQALNDAANIRRSLALHKISVYHGCYTGYGTTVR